jgi:DNA-binding NarL/FixJ family response regulator
MSGTRIVLADDHTLVRAGIRALVEAIDGATIVAEADNGREAVALAKRHHPDIVVMDITMQELNGIDAAARIVAEVPGTRVLMLSMHSAEEFVRRAIKAGASGYLVKDSAPMELSMALEALMRGEMFISSRVSRQLVSSLTDPRGLEPEFALDSLTTRQREVLQLLAEGKSTREMAGKLDVSVKTVETHRAAVMERLGIRDIAGLVRFAVENGLVPINKRDTG